MDGTSSRGSTAKITTGYTAVQTFNHVFVVHNRAGHRVTCAVIQNTCHKEGANEGTSGPVDGASGGDSTPASPPTDESPSNGHGSCTCFDRDPTTGDPNIPTISGCGFREPDARGCVIVASEDECKVAKSEVLGGLPSVAKFVAGGQCLPAAAAAAAAPMARRLRGGHSHSHSYHSP